MENRKTVDKYPHLLTREQAAYFLGIDPKSFDKYFRSNNNFKRFMVGRHERYTVQFITEFIDQNHV